MRFAVSLLTVLAIASVIGTVLKQGEQYVDYRIEFGEFWFAIFKPVGLFDVYHTSWFLLILGFLVLSTTLCIWRHAPGMLRDIRGYRENATRNSLRLMAHNAEADGEVDRTAAQAYLRQAGYRWRILDKDGVWTLAAKKGVGQRLGYFFAHAAIVVICIGGLMDGNLPLKLRELVGNKVPETRDLPQSKVPAQSRLSPDNLSFRGNVTLPEGAVADVVFLNSGEGFFVQDLPFALRLKQFQVDYYSTGMPKRFASSIDVLDPQTGKVVKSGVVEVNKPLLYDGIAIYQASFGDGGSPLQLTGWHLNRPVSQKFEARSRSTQSIDLDGKAYTLEFGDLRVTNVENMGKNTPDQTSAVAVNKLEQALASSQSVKSTSTMRNLGPMIQFKLRDSSGQAVEYQNYMSPFLDDGALYLMTGVRKEINAPFQYVRIPLDDDMKVDTFMRLRDVMLDSSAWAEIAKRTTDKAFQGGGFTETKRAEFAAVTEMILKQFAQGGFPRIDAFIREKVPEDKRPSVAQTYLKILQGATVDAMDIAQQRAGLQAVAMSDTQYRFLMDSLVATSGFFEYGSPVYLQPSGFTEVKSSGFQLTRSPGKRVVYLGSILLVIGIFCMFYLREERIWLRSENGKTVLALTGNRRSADLESAFERHRAALLPATSKEEIAT
ncbi:cytochrome c biogenesis protein ResB [Silvimonas amylolytica]|uniref:Cytochrome c biogenesis protein n=1 Tax=Silvimonas amylolytica TaxID=449663 RepID=A0ABQ2PLK7_9NEIS|nr:cytochrome c biogenesis protein ResB [Silvimonas amylolytica]GGP25882.1 cytochrome c biogenesis protein [Silvimonas amylolytica]